MSHCSCGQNQSWIQETSGAGPDPEGGAVGFNCRTPEILRADPEGEVFCERSSCIFIARAPRFFNHKKVRGSSLFRNPGFSPNCDSVSPFPFRCQFPLFFSHNVVLDSFALLKIRDFPTIVRSIKCKGGGSKSGSSFSLWQIAMHVCSSPPLFFQPGWGPIPGFSPDCGLAPSHSQQDPSLRYSTSVVCDKQCPVSVRFQADVVSMSVRRRRRLADIETTSGCHLLLPQCLYIPRETVNNPLCKLFVVQSTPAGPPPSRTTGIADVPSLGSISHLGIVFFYQMDKWMLCLSSHEFDMVYITLCLP